MPVIKRTCLAVTLLLTTTSAFAADFATIIIPLQAVHVPGAHGSIWHSQLSVHNSSDRPIDVFHPPTGGGETIGPGETVEGPTATAWEVSADEAQFLYFQVTLRNEADPFDAGTSLPVVRPDEWADSVILTGVPVRQHTRYHLRIYSTWTEGGTVRWRVLDERSGDLIDEQQIELRSSMPVSKGDVRGIEEILATAFPAPERVRVEVEPTSGEMPIFAFLSLTDNATQDVLIIEPE